MRTLLWGLLLAVALEAAVHQDTLAGRAQRYLIDLTRIDSSNPPGNETRVARYLQNIAEREGIPCELLGGNRQRLNFVARLKGSGSGRPLLLMAHSDVVPVDAEEWHVPPFSAKEAGGYIYGRGTLDDKSLLAAEMAVLVELKRSGQPHGRDVILLAEADEEAGSSGIQWLIENAWAKIDAEFAINEGGFVMDLPSSRLYNIETAEKVPMPVLLRAKGPGGHASLPESDNALLRVMRAAIRLSAAEEPVRLNPTTRAYFRALAMLPEFAWLRPLLPYLENERTAVTAADRIRAADPELDAELRTTFTPTLAHAGTALNMIPASGEVRADVRILPNETREEVLARLRRVASLESVEVELIPGHNMPPTEPSPTSTVLYQAMETQFRGMGSHVGVIPYMERGATDGSFLRAKGVAVYGLPLFLQGNARAHAANERIALDTFESGTRMLWKIVTSATEP